MFIYILDENKTIIGLKLYFLILSSVYIDENKTIIGLKFIEIIRYWDLAARWK